MNPDGYIDAPHKWSFRYADEKMHLLDAVSRLKQAADCDLLMWGTGQLTDALAAAGLASAS